MYYRDDQGRGLLNGLPFYTQIGGRFGKVVPHQANAEPWPDYPIPGLILQEFVPWFSPQCGHSIKSYRIIREFDYETNDSVALITCPECSYVQNYLVPFEAWLDPIIHAIIIA